MGIVMNPEADLIFWLIARVMGLSAFLALTIATLSGVALRTSVLDRLGTNRAWRELHTFSTALCVPLGAPHLARLPPAGTARSGPPALIVPFDIANGAL